MACLCFFSFLHSGCDMGMIDSDLILLEVAVRPVVCLHLSQGKLQGAQASVKSVPGLWGIIANKAACPGYLAGAGLGLFSHISLV